MYRGRPRDSRRFSPVNTTTYFKLRTDNRIVLYNNDKHASGRSWTMILYYVVVIFLSFSSDDPESAYYIIHRTTAHILRVILPPHPAAWRSRYPLSPLEVLRTLCVRSGIKWGRKWSQQYCSAITRQMFATLQLLLKSLIVF